MGDAALLIVLLINLQRRIEVSKSLGALPNPVGKGTQERMGTPKLNRITGQRALYARSGRCLCHCGLLLLLEQQESLLSGSMRIFIASLLPVEATLLVAQLRPGRAALDARLTQHLFAPLGAHPGPLLVPCIAPRPLDLTP